MNPQFQTIFPQNKISKNQNLVQESSLDFNINFETKSSFKLGSNSSSKIKPNSK